MDDYTISTEREVEEWPGASVSFDTTKRHRVAVLAYRGRTRRVIFSATPSDNARGLLNHIGEVRKELRGLGASRLKQQPSPHRDRERNKPVRPLPISQTPALTKPHPFEVLAAMKEKFPMTREVTINGKTVTLETGKAPPTIKVGRDKGPVRLLCEQMLDGESAFIPVDAKVLQSSNLSSISKVIGAKFAYRQEDGGCRIYRLAPEGNVQPIPAKKASGW